MKFDDYEIKFVTDTYAMDGSSYIGAYTTDGEFYGDITVCIPFMARENEIILDINNSPKIIKEMIKRKLISETGNTVSSGYCVYPTAKVTDKFYEEVFKWEE